VDHHERILAVSVEGWLLVMMVQIAFKRFSETVERRLLCFSLFWHALDIAWVWLFTVVYLMGVKP
jgi:cytochrome o ubiquinol oxidase subunit 3